MIDDDGCGRITPNSKHSLLAVLDHVVSTPGVLAPRALVALSNAYPSIGRGRVRSGPRFTPGAGGENVLEMMNVQAVRILSELTGSNSSGSVAHLVSLLNLAVDE